LLHDVAFEAMRSYIRSGCLGSRYASASVELLVRTIRLESVRLKLLP